MKRTKKYYRCGKRVPSAKCSKPRTITAHEALQLLESAVRYCQLAGMNVKAANGDGGTLRLIVPNAHYILTDNGTHAAFQLGSSLAEAQRTDWESIGTGEVIAHG